MPLDNDQADAIRVYLTGAGSDGGAQADPDASLGAYRSSTEFDGLGHLLKNAIPGLRIDHVSPENGPGEGVIASDGNAVAWKPPGGTRGTYVRILNGETRIIQAGNNEPGKFLRVTRTSAADLDGSTTVTLVDVFHALFDDVSNAERAAGDTEYRCLAFKVGPYATVRDFKVWIGLLGSTDAVDASGYASTGAVTVGVKSGLSDWPTTGYAKNDDSGEVLYYSSRTADALTVPAAGRDIWGDGAVGGAEDDVVKPIAGVRIGIEAPTAQPNGEFTTSADEDTDPGTVTFYTPTSVSDADALEPGLLTAGQIYGLWIERLVPAGAAATPRARTLIEWTFTAAS